ncbi:MAG: PAC2 family protein [Nanoarchaeota archaeon]|nr:PAC2 family protein [Nanoarchaeota archaeon]
MKEFSIKIVKKQDINDAVLVKGVPGVGSISHITVDYLINKLNAELICKIYSDYLPNIVLIKEDSSIEPPHYAVYFKKVGNKKIVFVKNNYPPTSEYYSFKTNNYLADFVKKNKIKQVITIAGIAYKELPDKITLHGAVTDQKLKKGLEKMGLIFDGNKSVGLIIGSAGLLLDKCAEKKIPGFCLLVSTWAHPNYFGIKESKKAISFLSEYLKFKVDLSDLNKEIRRINKEIKKVEQNKEQLERAEFNKSRYIG